MPEPAPYRVTYVIGELGTGGAEYQLYELLRVLDRRRFLPSVVVLSPGGYWVDPIRRLGVSVIELRREGPGDPRRLLRLRSTLRRLRPDLLQTVRWSGNSYGRLAAIGLGIPVVVASERVHEEVRPRLHNLFDRLLDRMTDAYLVNCEAIATGLVRQVGVARERIRVVTNGVDLSALPARLPDRRAGRLAMGLDPDRLVVAGIGRLTAQKDYPTFLAAVARLVAYRPDIDAIVVGDGKERRALEACAERLGIAGRVRFLGLRHDVPALLRGVDVVVMTSVFEGFPNVILEAMAMGAVAVATDVGGCRELIVPGETGLLVPPRDVEAVAAAVQRVLDDDRLAAGMAAAARARVEREFSVEVLGARTAGVYEDLLGGRRARAAA